MSVIKDPIERNQLVLLPGILLVILQWILRYLLPAIAPKAAAIGFLGGIACGLAIAVWWLFFSRAARIERWGAIILIIIVMSGTSLLLDKSISTANMGLMFLIFSIPGISLALVIWAVTTRNLSTTVRRITMVIFIIVASGTWILFRTNGMTGDGRHYLGWRWAGTKEGMMLAQDTNSAVLSLSDIAVADTMVKWPGFRGTNRDGIVKGIRIETDWSASPPVEMWRKSVGPGCSSFAIKGDQLYTQEQLGENETVSCYSLSTGSTIWKHGYKARFEESHAGPGPRSTPTLAGNHVYSMGATGILNVLDANTGSVIWSRNASADAGVTIPPWGFTSSPLVTGKNMIIAIAGKMAAFRLDLK